MSLPAATPTAHAAALNTAPAQGALLTLHRALEFRDLWGSVQQLFETLVPHDTLVMSVNYLDWRREASTCRLTSSRSRVVDDAKSLQMILHEGTKFFQPFLDRRPGIPCYHHTEVLADPRRIPQTGYYRAYMEPLGWRYSAHLLFWQGQGVDTSFALRRRADQGDFTPAEMALLRAVHPHISVAFERMRTFEQERQRRRLLESFYRAKPEAVLFLDWNLRLIYASQDAFAFCAVWNFGAAHARSYSPQAVFAIPGELTAACDGLKARWPSAAGPAGAPAQCAVAAPSGCEALITLRRENRSALTKPVFVIRLRHAEDAPARAESEEPDPARARRLHQLTPMEREMVALVCAGQTNKEIAAQLRKTEGSVKVQLSGVYQKLRVRSRAQLIVALH